MIVQHTSNDLTKTTTKKKLNAQVWIFFDFLWSTQGQNHTNIQYEHDAQPVVPLCSIKVFVCQHSLDWPILWNNEKHSWNSVKEWECKITQVGKVSLRHFSTTSGFNSISSNCVTTFPRCGGRPIWSPSEEIAWDVHEAPRLKPAMSCWTVLLSNSEASLISLWTERVLTKKEAPALVETFKLSWMKFAKPSGEKFYG